MNGRKLYIGGTGFEPATARPPSRPMRCHMRPNASPSVPASPAPIASGSLDRAFGTRSGTALWLPQHAEELVAIDTGISKDAAQRAALDVLGMNRDRDDVRTVGVRVVMVAALRASEPPTLLFQNPDQLPGSNRRQPTAHAATVTRSISAG